MLEVTDVSHKFGRTPVLFHLNFKVRGGEILGLLGPNGAGKSTTMRILTGYLSPTRGGVFFDGKDIEKRPFALRRHLGYLPENVVLYPEFRVAEYLNWVAGVKKSSRPAAEVEEAAERCGLEKVMDRLIRHLSRGYRQRVGLAQAILGPTRLLILDEPTVGLDPAQIMDIRKLIRELGKDKTILLSTHILPEVELTCDRVLIINKGRIVVEDTPANLVRGVSAKGRYLLRLALPESDAGQAAEALRERPFVSEVEVRETTGDGCLLGIKTFSGEDHRADITRAANEAGWPVLEFKPADASLEQAFINLISDENSMPLADGDKEESNGR
jgi:ABC-2 type transport system ATP-binding protein